MNDATLLLSSKAMIAGYGTIRLWPDPSSQLAKSMDLELKELTDVGAGEFEGLAAAYHALDLQGDVIDRGAFAVSLQRRRTLPLLFQHDPNQILGTAELTDTPEGLRVRGKLNLAVSRAAEIYALLRQKAIAGLSIGFTTITAAWVGTTRHLKEVALHEISLTPFPAQALATVSAVKSRPESEDEAALAGIVATLGDLRKWLRERER